MKRKAFKTQINLTFGIIVAIILLCSTIIRLFSIATTTIEVAEKTSISNASIAVNGFSNWLTDKTTLAETLATKLSVVDEINLDQLRTYLQLQSNLKHDIETLYFFTADGEVIDPDGWQPSFGEDLTQSGWYKGAMSTNGTYVSKPYTSPLTGTLLIGVSRKVTQHATHELLGVINMEVPLDSMQELIVELSGTDGTSIFIIDQDNEIVVHKEEINMPSGGKMKTLQSINPVSANDIIAMRDGDVISTITSMGDGAYTTAFAVPNTSYRMVSNYPKSHVTDAIWKEIISSILIMVISQIVFYIAVKIIVRVYIYPLEHVVTELGKLQQGNLNISTTHIARTTLELEAIVGALDTVSSSINGYIEEIAKILQSFSEGDFTPTPQQNYVGDFNKIKVSLLAISVSLKDLLYNTQSSTGNVLDAANQIAGSAQELADLTIGQVDLISHFKDETIQVAEGVIGIIGDIDKSYEVVNDMTNKALDSKKIGNDLVTAMKDISVSINEISGVIGSIENVATQTNLLALNASIEAARVGEQGKGFAVVANEIRELSTTTTQTVKDIYGRIEKNLESLRKGENMVQLTSTALDTIVQSSVETRDFSKNLSANATSQKESLHAIIAKVEMLQTEISKNSGISEENVAVSQELAAQADNLKGQLDKFEI